MPGLNPAVTNPLGIPNVIKALLQPGTQIEMILNEPAIELPRVHQQPLLELIMRETTRQLPRQPLDLALKQRPRTREPVRRKLAAASTGLAIRNPTLTSSPTRLTRQDFPPGRVKFSRTGVEISVHVATSVVDVVDNADLRHPSPFRELLLLPWVDLAVGVQDVAGWGRPGRGGQRPPSESMARAMTASGVW